MDFFEIAKNLDTNRFIFMGLLQVTEPKEYLYKPTPENWCMLEVVCHLLDEEREDFKKRMQHCLEHPKKAFDPIDPQGWVKSRNYIEQDFTEKVLAFTKERADSILWLASLVDPPLQNFHEHQHFGKMSAQFFLENWLAHDYLHIRQLIRLKNDYLRSEASEKLEYAGNW